MTYDELDLIYAMTSRINEVLRNMFAKMNIKLVDFKIEFGRTSDGEIVLADEVSPDTCRLWDMSTNEKLDKDRFRRDLGKVREAYEEFRARLQKFVELWLCCRLATGSCMRSAVCSASSGCPTLHR